MDTVYVLFIETRMVGVYTSHRKAMQAMIMDTVSSDMTLVNYEFTCDTEYFTYYDSEDNATLWSLQEITPDQGV